MRNKRSRIGWLIIMVGGLLGMARADNADPAALEAAARRTAELYLEQLVHGELIPALEMIDYEQLAAALAAQHQAQSGTPVDEALFRQALHPGRLRQVLRAAQTEIAWRDMTWQIAAVQPLSGTVPAFNVSYERRPDPDAPWEADQFAVLRRGSRWRVLPLSLTPTPAQPTTTPAPNLGAPTEPPADVRAAANAFWRHWQTGALDAAYNSSHSQLRNQVSQLQFLEGGAGLIQRLGVLKEWTLTEARPAGDQSWRLIFTLTGDRTLPAVMQVRQEDEGAWRVSALLIQEASAP
ncbi:MAG: hypothetical protein K9N49_03005 [Candidatus Marinimicrobia bacterium]|nr:hypothetical protein [Candidatus Neomarinimicrobiota bacterium]